MFAILWDHDYISLTTSLVMLAVAVGVMVIFIGLWWRGQGFEPDYDEVIDETESNDHT